MNYALVLGVLSFFTFFSSCNLFTLTGASSEVHGDFYNDNFTSSAHPPVVTSASVSSIFTGGTGNCGNGETIQVYGANFTSSTQFTLFRTDDGVTYSMTLNSIVDSSEASVTIGEALPIGYTYGIWATNEHGSSKAFAFNAGCA